MSAPDKGRATVLGRVKATRCAGALTRGLDPPCARRLSGGEGTRGVPAVEFARLRRFELGADAGLRRPEAELFFCHSPGFDPPEAIELSAGAPRAPMPSAEPSRGGRVKAVERSVP